MADKKDLPVAFATKMMQIYRDGGFHCHVAAAFEISESTFRNWRKAYPDFDEAAEIGKTLSEVYWIDDAKKNLKLDKNMTYNAILWYMMMRNRHNWGDKPQDRRRKVNLCGTLREKMVKIEELLQDGEITTTEHATFIDSLHKEAQVLEIYELQPRVDLLFLEQDLKNKIIDGVGYKIRKEEILARIGRLDDAKVRSNSQSVKDVRNYREKRKAIGLTARYEKDCQPVTLERINGKRKDKQEDKDKEA